MELFDCMVRAGPWQLATLDGLLARNPIPFSAVLVRDRGPALDLVRSRLDDGSPPIAIVGYSDAIEPARVVDAVLAGAVDYLAWPADPTTFADRLQIAAARAARKQRKTNMGQLAQARVGSLSSRERDVLKCLTNGDTSKSIARKLGISDRTVEVHRAKLLGKLGVATSVEAAIMAIKSDLF